VIRNLTEIARPLYLSRERERERHSVLDVRLKFDHIGPFGDDGLRTDLGLISLTLRTISRSVTRASVFFHGNHASAVHARSRPAARRELIGGRSDRHDIDITCAGTGAGGGIGANEG
jgi:hypothetical protein